MCPGPGPDTGPDNGPDTGPDVPGDAPLDASGGEAHEPSRRRRAFPSLSAWEGRFVLDALRQETVGGLVLLAATVVAIGWASSPWGWSYEQIRVTHLGPLTIEQWTSEGLLAIFFFVAGLELVRELTVGSLRRPAEAIVPIVAAVSGMVVPAIVFLVVVGIAGDPSAADGWAVPMATDIAFALAVLAIGGSQLPGALRAFLLTLAIVDDLGAITIIAFFFTPGLNWLALLGAIVAVAVYAWLQRRRVRSPWIYLPLALVCWWLVHASGVHATIAGVALGLATRVRPDPDEEHSPAERLEHLIRPISAGFAVPGFAFFAAGVPLSLSALQGAARDAAAVGIVLGLVVGKALGVFGGTWLTTRFTRAELDPDLTWRDVLALAFTCGIGFTVALLVSGLAFEGQPVRLDATRGAVLLASICAALVAAYLLRRRRRVPAPSIGTRARRS